MDKRILEIIKDNPENNYINWYSIFSSRENLNSIPPDILLNVLKTRVGREYYGIGKERTSLNNAQNYINILLHNYEDLTIEIVDELSEFMRFMNVETNSFGTDDLLLYCKGFMLSLREHVIRGRREFVEELVIKYYKRFITELEVNLNGFARGADKPVEAIFQFLYCKFVDSNPSDEMKVFLKLQ